MGGEDYVKEVTLKELLARSPYIVIATTQSQPTNHEAKIDGIQETYSFSSTDFKASSQISHIYH